MLSDNRPKIYYKFYNPSGLFNQVLSLEVAAGIYYKTKREIVLYNVSKNLIMNPIFSPSQYSLIYPDMVSQPQKIRIDDIFIWDHQKSFTIIDQAIDENIYLYKTYDVQKTFLVDYFDNSQDLNIFAEGRTPIIIENEPVNFINTLNFYSYFFYNKDQKFNQYISSVKPKNEYVILANKIAKSIGQFSAIHLRLTDFPRNMYNVSYESFESGLKLINKEYPIVISTDEPKNDIFKKYKKDIIFLDEYIYNNFKEDFKKLQFSDDIIFGLINNLVLHHSIDFIGTQGSTFTAYIQRGRIKNNKAPSWKMFDDLNYKKTQRYSWIGYNRNSLEKCWWREWEEC